MCVKDIEEIYDFIELNNVNDICDLILYAMSPENDIKLNWLDCLSNDKIVDLIACKIKEKNHYYNLGLIKNYYEKYIGNCI